MAKRLPRQELRATTTRVPYRREKPGTAPPPVDLDLPMPPAVSSTFDLATLPELAAVAHSALGFTVASIAHLPAPTELVRGEPTAAEPPPGRAPAGDARSMRSADQFVLIYRHGAALVSRRGRVGQRGVWRVVDYPGPAHAAHAYALECSTLSGQGFRDVD